MHYKVRNLEIRSENAAKPLAQRAKPLARWLGKLDPVRAALDFGCGKLRYSGVLAAKCAVLTLVDSKVQLERLQKVGRKETTVRHYARSHWPRCRVLSAEEFERDQKQYDFVLCANVLSAIPNRNIRSAVLMRLAAALRSGGRCLFVTQYRNSYFKKVAASSAATGHLDGWILKTRRGNFYYGILNKEKLVGLIAAAGFRVKEAWVEGESAYALAGRENSA